MNKHLIHLTSPALVLALMFLTAPATAQDPMHARVSFESGGAMVQGTADETWSYATVNTIVLPGDNLWADQGATIELEISGGTFLRMADGSKAEVLELSPNTTLRGWTGAFYVQRIARSTGDFLFITPACRIEVEKNSHVRVDVLDGGSTTVSVRWGHAVIRTDSGGAVNVSAGRRIFVDVGLLPSTPVSFDRSLEDPFDAWCRERAELLATGEQTVPKTVSAGYPVGMSDLGSYGNWVVVEERQYWRPTVVVDYVPYRRGYWSYVPAYGHVWVGDYPFCYVTSHYGRWIHHSRYGWMWTYSPGWSPAWVASVRYGDYFVWAPLNVYNRPVTYGDLHFTVDGYRFSLTASSYTRVTDLFYGPSYVSACYPGIVSRTRPAEVHIWNIYAPGATININNNWHRQAGPDRVRDYSPRRVIRGPDTIGPRMEAASTRIATLESGLGRRAFAPAAPAGARQAPTMVNQSAQGGRMRSVAIRNEATPLTSDVLARASGSGDAVRDARSVRSGSPVTVPRSADAQGADRSRAVVGGPLTQGPSGGAPDRTVSSAAPSAGASAPAMTRSAPRAESSASSSAPTTSEVRRGPRTIPPPATTTQTPSVSAPGRTPTHGAPPSRTVGGDTPSRAPSTTATPRWESPRTGGERAPSSGPVTVPRSTPPSVSAPSVRQAPSAPTVRSVPQTPAPSVRYAPSTPAPTVRQAPPTTSTPRYQPAPTPAPSVRAAPPAPTPTPRYQPAPTPAPSVRSAPSVSAPSPVRAAPSAPSVRSAPSPSVGSFGPSRSTSVRAR